MEINALGKNISTSAISANIEGALDKASAGAHAALNSIAGVADDVARRAQPAIERVASMAHNAVDKAAGVAAPTADWLSAQGESLNATQKKLVSNTCGYVSANPFKALGVAVVAGILLGRIILK